jgi:hypothetical protein
MGGWLVVGGWVVGRWGPGAGRGRGQLLEVGSGELADDLDLEERIVPTERLLLVGGLGRSERVGVGHADRVRKAHVLKEVKRHSYYLKPGEKKRVKQALARKRNRKKMRRDGDG